MCHTHYIHRSAMQDAFLLLLFQKDPCHIVQSFEVHILFEPTRFFEEVEFAKSMSSAQENEVGVSFGILLIFR